MKFARIGAVLYIIWGLLHIAAAFDEFALARTLDHGLLQGKINQQGWDLLFFAVFAIVVAVRYIWKNDPLGYWLNLIVVSSADIGFLIFVFFPGNTTIFPSILGPIFWILAAIFTTVGFRTRENS